MQAQVNGKLFRYDFKHDPYWLRPQDRLRAYVYSTKDGHVPILGMLGVALGMEPAPDWQQNRADLELRAFITGLRRPKRLGLTACDIYEVEPDPACIVHTGRTKGTCSCKVTHLVTGMVEKSAKDKNYSRPKGRMISLGRALAQLFPDDVDARNEFLKQYENRPRPKSTPKTKPSAVHERPATSDSGQR